MSSKYRMDFIIPRQNLTNKELVQIQNILMNFWEIESPYVYKEHEPFNDNLYLYGTHNLCGDSKTFAKEVFETIFSELDKYVEMEIQATKLEDLPYESHSSSEVYENCI